MTDRTQYLLELVKRNVKRCLQGLEFPQPTDWDGVWSILDI